MTPSLIDRFIANHRAVSGVPHTVADDAAAAAKAVEIITASGARCVALARLPTEIAGPIAQACAAQGIEVLQPPYAPEALPGLIDRADVGVTMADFAVAESATLAEISTNDVTRIISGLPRTHIGLVRASEIVPRLGDAAPRIRDFFSRHAGGAVISFISGPSRTGDIEMILTLGVHGPGVMHAILIGDAHA
jgi:L-lactate dehydrogenase complex protein LldG